MYAGWKKLLKVPDEYERLLETASLLHDIGITINYYSHARHSSYMIQNANLFGLNHEEQAITSAIAGWHNGISKYYFRDKFYKEMIDEAAWPNITKLACILTIAECLDITETNSITDVKASLAKGKALLTVYTNGSATLELQLIQNHLNWFKKTFGVPLIIDVQ